MSGFASPNHTQTPNELFDKYMAVMGESELKVTLAIIRKTLGYHKVSDPISLTQLQKMTGLSRQGVIDGAEAAVARGLLERVGTGKRGVIIYGMVIGSDQSTTLTSDAVDQSTELTTTSQQSRHTKETSTKEKKTPRKRATDPYYDNIAKVWGITAGGWIGNLKSMFLGTAKRGEWERCNFNPPVTDPAEILAFEKYMLQRMAEKNITDKPTACVTIQRWFYDFRREGIKPVLSVLDGLRLVS